MTMIRDKDKYYLLNFYNYLHLHAKNSASSVLCLQMLHIFDFEVTGINV